MNKIGISIYYGFKLKKEENLKLIKSANIDNIITNADRKFIKENGNIRTQIKLFKKYNLGVSSLHMRYKNKELPYFWKDCKIGNKIEKNLIKDIKIAHKYGFKCVVVHLDGEPSEIGYKRINKILKYAKTFNTPLAIENIDHNKCFFDIFERIDNPYLKFCYDIGHSNVWNKDVDFLEKYGDKLICLHLHDNCGNHDDHTLNKYGTIDWEKFAQKIAKINPEINLDYELLLYTKPDNETAESVVYEVYKQGKELEKLIEKYKK